METTDSNASANTVLTPSPLEYPADTQPLVPGLVENAHGSLFGHPQCSPVHLEEVNAERIETPTEFEHERYWIHRSDSEQPLAPVPLGTSVNLECPQTSNTNYYPCLEPLLPALEGFLSPSDACALLDIYFAQEEGSFTSGKCPYILTPVLRKKSLLHQSQPRLTSPALVATMLWAVAQTAEACLYYEPGKRDCITDRLYSLVLSHFRLRDIDNWHRVPGSAL